MRRFAFGASFAVLLFGLGTATANADIVTFQLQNVTFVNPDLSTPEGTATGTITIDTTLGQWVSGDITYVNGATTLVFDGPPTSTIPSVDFGLFATGEFFNGSDSFAFAVNVASLVGYTGGPLCGVTNVACVPEPGVVLVGDVFGPDANALMATGSLVQSTPEPSTLALLGTGMLGVARLVRRRVVA